LLELASVLTRNRVEVLVAHNASFDRAFLEQAWRREGFAGELPPFLCTLELSQRLLRSRGYALGALAERLDLPGGARHRALADAQVAAALLGVLLERARRKRVRSLDALLAFSRRPRPVLWRLGRRLTRPWRRWRQRRRDVGRGAVDDGTVIR
jgi:DNA polymerase-3 subunit epsilon